MKCVIKYRIQCIPDSVLCPLPRVVPSVSALGSVRAPRAHCPLDSTHHLGNNKKAAVRTHHNCGRLTFSN